MGSITVPFPGFSSSSVSFCYLEQAVNAMQTANPIAIKCFIDVLLFYGVSLPVFSWFKSNSVYRPKCLPATEWALIDAEQNDMIA